MPKQLTIALAGNPNSGKTTVFNALTGARQHVGNYPGVTVEKVEGKRVHGDWHLHIVDLPGTYSLTAYSVEERVARDFVLDQAPDVVVDIVDASNLERNLYLATQLLELDVPLVLAFNMSDVAQARGFELDIGTLSAMLGAPIVPTTAHKGIGLEALLDAAVEVAVNPTAQERAAVHYGRDIERGLSAIEERLRAENAIPKGRPPRWTALKLLERDPEISELVARQAPGTARFAAERAAHVEAVFGDTPEVVVADRRYGFISGACQETVRSTVEARHDFSDRVDAVLAHRVLGLPLFLLLMYVVFHLVFTLGEYPMHWLEWLFAWASESINTHWPLAMDSPLRSLLVDGIIGGVGGVVVFLPNILLLFLAIALLEDTGYMARAAFIMDQFMHRFHLHGKSFIPMLIGFGCSVPAIMATRTLESRRDRLTTIMIAPLMSCGARLPIYALLIPAFFARQWHGPLLWLMYVTGIVLALVAARLLRATLFKGESTPFVMELPPYRMPTLRGLLTHMWQRGWMYLRKAGTIILAISIVLWALTSYPKKEAFSKDYAGEIAALREARAQQLEAFAGQYGIPLNDGVKTALRAGNPAPLQDKQAAAFVRMVEELRAARNDGHADAAYRIAALEARNPALYAAAAEYLDDVEAPFRKGVSELKHARAAEAMAHSAAGRIGHAIAPVLAPLGFDWRIGTALIGAFAAKEVFVAQLGIVHAVGSSDEDVDALRTRLRDNYTPLTAFCIMLFCLISSPCMATVAVTRGETGSWRLTLLQWGGLTLLGYLITACAYQIGSLLGLGVV